MAMNFGTIQRLSVLFALQAATYAQEFFPDSSGLPTPLPCLQAATMFGVGPAQSAEETLSLPLPSLQVTRLDRHVGVPPLYFERNEGQCDSEARFLMRGPGYHLFLTQTEAVMVLFSPEVRPRAGESERVQPGSHSSRGMVGLAFRSEGMNLISTVNSGDDRAVLRMRMVGAKPSPSIRAVGELPGKVNYFIGNDPGRWRTKVPTYARVRLEHVYPGIDVVYYSTQGRLEYDFVLAPGADPGAIGLAFEGAARVQVDPDGGLMVEVRDRQIRWHRPHVYQELNGERKEVLAEYQLSRTRMNGEAGEHAQVTFRVAAFDRTSPLVIDPVLVYSTYLGGSDVDHVSSIAVDSQGSAYLTGLTRSLDFPTTNAIQPALQGTSDAFVTKLNPAGDGMLYSTYLSGSSSAIGASVSARGASVAVDGQGNTVVVGSTTTTDFPTTNALQAKAGGGGDAFFAKLSADGARLIFSTYFGGSGADYAWGIALDVVGNIYVTGETHSTDFPTINPFQAKYGGAGNAFVAKLDPLGTGVIYSTYLGGSGGDFGGAIAVDAVGHTYIAGITDSIDFPTKNPVQTVPNDISFTGVSFVSELGVTGSDLLYSTYLDAQVLGSTAIALDTNGNAFVTGSTGPSNILPATPQVFQPVVRGLHNAFVAKLNPTGSAFDYLTFLGGTTSDSGVGIAVDAAGNAYVAGSTSSTNFPTLNPLQPQNNATQNGDNAFLAKLNSSGSALVWSTYYGGTGSDSVSAVALDPFGAVYFAGNTTSSDFPVQGGVQSTLAGGTDAFVVKIAEPPPPPMVQISRSGDTVVLTWPTNASSFNLESSDTLAPSPNWTGVAFVPVIAVDQNVVTVQADGSSKFFRLHKQ
jgi:hypothetical protein